MSKAPCSFLMLPKGEKDMYLRSYVLKGDDTFIIFTSFLYVVLCVKCYLHMFELIKICIMQLFLDYWFEEEIDSS